MNSGINSPIFTDLFLPGGFFVLLGYLVFVLELLYLVFAFIIIRQVTLMNNSLKTTFGPVFLFLAYVHFFATLGLALISLLVLF